MTPRGILIRSPWAMALVRAATVVSKRRGRVGTVRGAQSVRRSGTLAVDEGTHHDSAIQPQITRAWHQPGCIHGGTPRDRCTAGSGHRESDEHGGHDASSRPRGTDRWGVSHGVFHHLTGGESRRTVMAVTSLAMLIASSTLIGISFTG